MPATVTLSGPLRLGDDDLRVDSRAAGHRRGLRIRGHARAVRVGDGRSVVVRRGDVDARPRRRSPCAAAARRPTTRCPTLDAHGTLALGRRLALQLDGVIAHWPDAWPTLPPPIGQSRSPLPFALDYDGKADFSDTAALQLRRDATASTAASACRKCSPGPSAAAAGSPLPPIDGTLTTPKLEICRREAGRRRSRVRRRRAGGAVSAAPPSHSGARAPAVALHAPATLPRLQPGRQRPLTRRVARDVRRPPAGMVRRQRPPRPALAAPAHAVPRVAVGDHAAADPGQDRGALLPALRRGLAVAAGARRRAAG